MFKMFGYAFLVLTIGLFAAVAWTNAPGHGKAETSSFAPEHLRVNTAALPAEEFVDRSLVFVKE